MLLTDKDISEVNYSSTTENRILYIIGVSQNQEELDKVLYHAGNVAGVKKIINLVKIKTLQVEKSQMSKLKIAVQMDPPENLDKKVDSTLALMEEAIKRLYKVSIYNVEDLTLENNNPKVFCKESKRILISQKQTILVCLREQKKV